MRKYSVTGVFLTLVLFTLFVGGSFIILLSGANSYQNMLTSHQQMEQLRSPLAYVSTKVKAASLRENVSIEMFEGKNCLLIHELTNGKDVTTCIFYQEGALYEAYARTDQLHVDLAEKIMSVSDFEMVEENSYFVFTATNESGESTSLQLGKK